MKKLIALVCVVSWAGFWSFGYLALSASNFEDGQVVMAATLAFVGFITLVLIPIPMIRELGITASIGIGYKIVTNLVMLPVVISYVRLDAVRYGEGSVARRDRREARIGVLGRNGQVGRELLPRLQALGTVEAPDSETVAPQVVRPTAAS